MKTSELMNIALRLAGLEKEPYDTKITVEGDHIQNILIGVDMETPEMLLARDLGFDLVVSHHPKADEAIIDFYKVMEVQIDKMMEFGVPINKAQKALAKRSKLVEINSHVSNYSRTSSAAKLLNIPYMNIHMPSDLIGERYTQKYLDDKLGNNQKAKVQDILDALNELELYEKSLSKPVVRCGSATDYAGKIAVLFAGGTNGGSDVYKAYFEAGVGTIVAMHAPEDVIKEVREQNIGNIVVAGHMPSDSIGLNEIIKAWEEKGMKITKMSGIL